jgi:hypothetical protein
MTPQPVKTRFGYHLILVVRALVGRSGAVAQSRGRAPWGLGRVRVRARALTLGGAPRAQEDRKA